MGQQTLDILEVLGTSTFNGISTFKGNVSLDTGKTLTVGGVSTF